VSIGGASGGSRISWWRAASPSTASLRRPSSSPRHARNSYARSSHTRGTRRRQSRQRQPRSRHHRHGQRHRLRQSPHVASAWTPHSRTPSFRAATVAAVRRARRSSWRTNARAPSAEHPRQCSFASMTLQVSDQSLGSRGQLGHPPSSSPRSSAGSAFGPSVKRNPAQLTTQSRAVAANLQWKSAKHIPFPISRVHHTVVLRTRARSTVGSSHVGASLQDQECRVAVGGSRRLLDGRSRSIARPGVTPQVRGVDY